MEIRLVTDADEFLALRPAWNDLSHRVARNCVFLTHDWFDAAWRWRCESASLYLLSCWEEGVLAGILPLVRMHRSGTLGSQVLEFLAVPDTQVCDAIVDSARQETVAACLAEELVRRQAEWDVMRLRYLPEGSIVARLLSDALAVRRVRSVTRVATGNLFVSLTATWDAYYATRSRRLKKAVNLAANRLAKSGPVAIEWRAPAPGEAIDQDAIVGEITAVSARSWKSGTGNSLDQSGPRAFMRKLTEHATARGWLSVWTLRVGGRALAMEYQLRADGNVYAMRSDFDADFEQISPGTHLSRYLLERLFGRGLHRYLMGPGDNAYKSRWTADSEPVLEMSAYGHSVRGRLLAAWELTLKPPLRRMRERLRARE